MNKMLKNICLANEIDLNDPEAARKAMDILTGNDGESVVHSNEPVHYCGSCDAPIDISAPVNFLGHLICPHCKAPNIPPK
jgi:hypothetical protein